LKDMHGETRRVFGLPRQVPKSGSAGCHFCVNECLVEEGGEGFCGVRVESGGKLRFRSGSPRRAYLEYYYDPLPTNCVADWVCPAREMEGKRNLAVFYRACSFDCIFCQNFIYRLTDFDMASAVSDDELAECATGDTGCICYFGGDPTPQIFHSISAARLARKKGDVRICWETNGSMSRAHLKRITDIAFESGGIIKFDLKTYSERLSLALCGATNKRTLANFKAIASRFRDRETPPLVVASTLLVPGYVDVEEVNEIGHFIASLDPEIPYSLLGFNPMCSMSDLPTTSREHAARAREAAVAAGLQNVHIGNIHLLTDVRYQL